MKKLILAALIVAFSWSGANAQVQSLIQGATGPNGTISGTFGYFATGTTDEPVTYETQALSKYSLNGEFPQVVIYKAGAGAYQSETLIQMEQGRMSTLEKVGSSTLRTFQDPNVENRINGVLVQSAAGTSTFMIGQAQYGSVFRTDGGLQMATQAQFLGDYGNWKVGAVQYVTEGFGPAPGFAGDVGSQMVVRWEEHVTFGGWGPSGPVPFAGSYSVSMNPSVSLLPTTP